MTIRPVEVAATAAGLVYLVALSWSIGHHPYDVWGGLVILPPIALASVVLLRRLFADQPQLLPIMLLGLAAKGIGVAARYWIGFDAYDGAIDAAAYHEFGAIRASGFWAGRVTLFNVLPRYTGTSFVDQLTAFIYTFTGWSRISGFVVYGWLGFWGVAFMVKAALVAVPGLSVRRYAILCLFAPSLVYWPSSIGKEAWMLFTLGLATYGFALLISRRSTLRGIVITVLGMAGAAFVRPHMAGMWLAGFVVALAVGLFAQPESQRAGRTDSRRLVTVLVLLLSLGALAAVGAQAIEYLSFGDDSAGSGSVTSILGETTRRTAQARSSFTPPTVDGPQTWPYAALRTLTRPLPFEARTAFQLVSAAEMTVLVGLCLVSGRRMLALPRTIARSPFVAFALMSAFAAGLAYSSFANLGVLTRQKALILPLLLLIPCCPARTLRTARATPRQRADDEAPARELGRRPAGVGLS